jgi:hypothetical protein
LPWSKSSVLIQVGNFFPARIAAENGVSVGKPTEAGDHIPVCHRVIAEAGYPFPRSRVTVFEQAVKAANARFL